MITLISVYTLCSFPRRLDEWWTNNKSLADKLPLPRHAYFTHFYLFIRGFAILYSISSGVKDRRMWGDWAIRGSGVRGNPTNVLPYLLVENCGKIRKWILCTEKAHMLSWRYSQDTVSKQSPVQYTKVSISQKMRQKLQQFFSCTMLVACASERTQLEKLITGFVLLLVFYWSPPVVDQKWLYRQVSACACAAVMEWRMEG